MSEFQAAATIAQSISVVAVLLFFVWAFYAGKIVSRPVVDELVKSLMAEVRQMFQEILDEIDNGRGPKKDVKTKPREL